MHAQFSFPHGSESLAREQYVSAASDLLSRMQNRAPRRIADLKAGPQSMQALLAQRFPDAEIVSLDASRVDRANENEFDLIFTNGDLDLLPSLHELLPVLVTRLSFGGSLAVQIPNNLYEPNRALLRMVAADGPWAKKLLPVAKTRPFNEMMESL
jgi:trans-aconitate 2-methyltransferase